MDRREADRARHHRLVVLVLAAIAVLVSVSVAAAGPQPAPQPASQTYRSQQYGWSITVPGDWTIDDSNPADVRFMTGNPTQVLIGVHVATAWSQDLEHLVDQVVAYRAKMFLAAGQPYTILSRTSGRLGDGTSYVEIEERIGAGVVGHARLRFFLLDHTAEAVNAESFETVWAVISDTVNDIMGSFRPGAPDGGS
ncbi:MAG TPA: hypothetical protein VG894_09915 [Bauldia sp.]|nr:hypothetical protein [Bauldia sp.]